MLYSERSSSFVWVSGANFVQYMKKMYKPQNMRTLLNIIFLRFAVMHANRLS